MLLFLLCMCVMGATPMSLMSFGTSLCCKQYAPIPDCSLPWDQSRVHSVCFQSEKIFLECICICSIDNIEKIQEKL